MHCAEAIAKVVPSPPSGTVTIAEPLDGFVELRLFVPLCWRGDPLQHHVQHHPQHHERVVGRSSITAVNLVEGLPGRVAPVAFAPTWPGRPPQVSRRFPSNAASPAVRGMAGTEAFCFGNLLYTHGDLRVAFGNRRTHSLCEIPMPAKVIFFAQARPPSRLKNCTTSLGGSGRRPGEGCHVAGRGIQGGFRKTLPHAVRCTTRISPMYALLNERAIQLGEQGGSAMNGDRACGWRVW